MFNSFKPQTNQYHRDVHVVSSRNPTQIVRCYSDEPIDEIDALRAVDAKLSSPDLGDVRQIKTFFG